MVYDHIVIGSGSGGSVSIPLQASSAELALSAQLLQLEEEWKKKRSD